MTFQFVPETTQTQFTQFMLQPTENRDYVIPHFFTNLPVDCKSAR